MPGIRRAPAALLVACSHRGENRLSPPAISRGRPAHSNCVRHGTRPAWALAAAVLGFFVITLDVVVLNVALPSIRGDLGSGISVACDLGGQVPCDPMRPSHADGDHHRRSRKHREHLHAATEADTRDDGTRSEFVVPASSSEVGGNSCA